MTDEKQKKARRPKDVIAAEKRAWLARHDWQGMRDAVEFADEAGKMLEQAHGAAAERGAGAPFKAALQAIDAVRDHLLKVLPAEAR